VFNWSTVRGLLQVIAALLLLTGASYWLAKLMGILYKQDGRAVEATFNK
jgi:hypothetical protein